MTRMMICVDQKTVEDTTRLRIWGMLDTGENWWKFITHETSGGTPPPNHLTVSSSAPGELSVSASGMVLLSLRKGLIYHPSRNILWEGSLHDFLAPAAQRLQKEVISGMSRENWDETGRDEDYPQRFYTFFLEGILNAIRAKKHGGTLIIVPDSIQRADSRLTDRIAVKYPCEFNVAWDLMRRSLINHHLFYELYFPLSDGKVPLTMGNFKKYESLRNEGEEIDEQLSDIRQTIASLTAVDGAVVMSDRFQVLGFGGEVIAVSPSLHEVVLAEDMSTKISIEGFGTRHRSAFRFCSSLEQSAAFIVSQDSGVKAVKREGSNVLFWPDINTGIMGI
jgi:hypothetical protein